MYAIYLNDIERFAAIDSDLWMILSASRLLSSKLSICVCDIGDTVINNYNCFQWTLATPILPTSTQYPRLVLTQDIVPSIVGDPIGVDFQLLKTHQEFCLAVLNTIRAAKMTDAVLNFADRKYFQTLLGVDNINSTSDDSGILEGFLLSVERVCYLSQTKEELNIGLANIFNNPQSIFPRNLEVYKITFYNYLNA